MCEKCKCASEIVATDDVLNAFECGYSAGEEQGYRDAMEHYRKSLREMEKLLTIFLAKEGVGDKTIDEAIELIGGFFK